MNIDCALANGSTGHISLALVPDMVLKGGDWLPGFVATASDGLDPMAVEWILHDLNQGDRSGILYSDDDPFEWEPASWSMSGSPEEECKALLGIWALRFGGVFDPEAPASSNLSGIDEGEARKYEADRSLWSHFLPDPSETLNEVVGADPDLFPRRLQEAFPVI